MNNDYYYLLDVDPREYINRLAGHLPKQADRYAFVARVMGVNPRTVSNWASNPNNSIDRRMPYTARLLAAMILGDVAPDDILTYASQEDNT